MAHIARPIYYSRRLHRDQYQVGFACDGTQKFHFEAEPEHDWLPIESIDNATFTRRLYLGAPVYRLEELRKYVRDDLKVIEAFRPDLIIGDFRLSLAVSARISRVPYAALANAYWNPEYRTKQLTIGHSPLTEWLPVPIGQAIFTAALPAVHWLHTSPMRRLRAEFGLAPTSPEDLFLAYLDADQVLYTDIALLYAESPKSASSFIGPCLWEASTTLPSWWGRWPADRPVLYLTMGSTGRQSVLPEMLEVLGRLPVSVLFAGAGARVPNLPANCFSAPYLPGNACAAVADLVVFNGGSGTAQQAAKAGVPMLAVCTNMDQYMGMERLAALSAAKVMRSDRFTKGSFKKNVHALLRNSNYAVASRMLAGAYARDKSAEHLVQYCEWVTGAAVKKVA